MQSADKREELCQNNMSIIGEYSKLEKRVVDQQKLLEQERRKKKPKANELMEKETGDTLNSFDFWCDTCQEDFSAPCYKTKHRLYGDTVAVWRAKCPDCGEDCIRHITHKDEDLYYDKSTKIRHDRNQYAWDMLQSHEYGFRTHYGEPFKEYNEEMQRKEKKIIEQQRGQGLDGWDLESKQRLKRLLNS